MTIIWPWSLHGHGGQWHYWLTMFDHGRLWPVSYGQFMANDSQSCIRPWSTMVNHDHLEAYWPWNDHHLTMVITWLTMVMVLLTDHGQPWLTMVNISNLTTVDHHMTMTTNHGHLEAYWPWNDHHLTMVNISDLTTIDHHMTMTIDHGRPWSWPSFHFTNMVDHGQTMVNWWSFHGRPWLMTMIDHGQTMVEHGLTMILLQGRKALKFNHIHTFYEKVFCMKHIHTFL